MRKTLKSALCLSILALALSLQSCGKGEVKTQVNLAANRAMGYSVRFASPPPTSDRINLYNGAIEFGLRDAYGSKLARIEFSQGSLVEDPENLYQIGLNKLDDLFSFTIEDKIDAPEITVSILNGSNLKTVTILKFAVPREGEMPFTDRFIQIFKRVSLENYPNPNIYPKSDPAHFANLLFVYSQQKEKSLAEPLTCENSSKVLDYYPKALKLYELTKEAGSIKVVGQQAEAHQLNVRLQESAEKAQVLQACMDDAKKGFALEVDFGTIDPTSHPTIMRAVKNANLEEILKQYTSKPVNLQFTLDDKSQLNLLVKMRFEQTRYLAWTKNRIPHRLRNYSILSLDPFYALLQKLVVMRASLPVEASPALRSSFGAMKLNLALTTILNGQVLMGAEGKYDPKTKSIAMAYPNSVILSSPGFESKLIAGRDQEIFQEKTWIALGNCKTLDGTMTEDGLLIRFFGLPCN